jgi:hypothetical protein
MNVIQQVICYFVGFTIPGAILITGFRARALRNLRSSHSLIPAVFAFILSTLAGCGNSTKPQVASITFATDLTGAKTVCTTAVTSDTTAGTPLCSASLLPSLAVGGQAAYLYANVIDDDQDLGVSWTVTCGSAASAGSGAINTSCGTFSYAQTLSGPVPLYKTTGIVTTFSPPSTIPKGETVTITAHATSLPSVTSSVTLSIVAAQSSFDPRASGRKTQGPQTASVTKASPGNCPRPETQRSEL